MTPARFVEKRLADWQRLEQALRRVEGAPDLLLRAEEMFEFSRLYRAVCTDLSLAGANRLSRDVQLYLEDLVSRSHAALYTVRRRRLGSIYDLFVLKMPAAVFGDRYIRITLLAFFLPMFFCGVAAYHSRGFAAAVLGEANLEAYVEMHLESRKDPSAAQALVGTALYINHNTSIALLTFAVGILGGVLSLLLTLYNAVHIGSAIGYLLSSPARDNILSWIPGHGPFELTAIAIAAGAGLRIGFAWIAARGRMRLRALREETRAAMPALFAACLLLLIAAALEAALAPAEAPLWIKFTIGGLTLVFLIVYFGIGGRLAWRILRKRELDGHS